MEMRSKTELDDASAKTKSNPYAWIEQGNLLLKAAELVISTQLSVFMAEDPPDLQYFTGIEAASLQRRFSRTYVYRLLLGSALECFLKAHPENSDAQTHDLVQLAAKAAVPLNEHHQVLVRELGMFAVIGRYPFVSNKLFRRLNSGHKTMLDMWAEVDNAETKRTGKFVTGDKIHFGFIDRENAEIELDFVRKIREFLKKEIGYESCPPRPS